MSKNSIFKIERTKSQEARCYYEYLHQKVEAARASIREGKGIPNEEVERIFSARRKQAVEG